MQYLQKSLIINKKLEYPTPSGVYLTRVNGLLQREYLKLFAQPPAARPAGPDPLLALVTDVRKLGGMKSYDKEVSESMAVVDATERAVRLLLRRAVASLGAGESERCALYCVGDGKYPVTAACLTLRGQGKGSEISGKMAIGPNEHLVSSW